MDEKLESSSLKNTSSRRDLAARTISGLFWAASGSGIQALLKLVVVMFLGRLLTQSEFGVVTAALVVITFMEIFVHLGIGPAIIQRATIEARHLRVGFTLMLIFGSLATAILWICSPYIANFFRIEELSAMLKVLSINFIIQSSSIISASLTFRDMDFRLREGIRTFSYAFGYGLVGVVLAFLNYGAWSLVIATVTQQVIASVLYNITKPHPKHLSLDVTTVKELVYYGGGHSLASLFFKGASQGDNIVVGRTLGADELGVYGRAYQLMVLPAALFQQVLDKVLFPALAKVQDEVATLERTYRRGLLLTSLFTLPLSIVLFVFAPEYVHLILGPQWSETVLPFQVLAIGMVFKNTSALNDTVSRATGAVYNRAWRQAVYAVSVVLGAWVGHFFGITGVAIGTLVAILINFLMMTQLSLKLVNLTWSSVLKVYYQVAVLAVFVALESWIIAVLLRGAHLPPIAIVLLSSSIIMLTVLGLARFAPKWTFGEDGVWMFDQVKQTFTRVRIKRAKRT